MHYGSLLAESVASATENYESGRPRLAACILACARAGYLDGLVFAYRLYPHLLRIAHDDPRAMSVLKSALEHAGDYDLARSARIELSSLDRAESMQGLTKREIQVLGLISEGMSNEEIAKALYITQSTTKVHVRNILRKLGARNRLQAMLKAEGRRKRDE